jgi:hypothetical protein
MADRIDELEQKIDNLQKTLDWMIEHMWRAQSLRSLEPIEDTESSSIGLDHLFSTAEK